VTVAIGRYVSSDTIRLGACGLAAGLASGLAWRAMGRARWGAGPFLVAAVGAAAIGGRSDRPSWYAMVAPGVIVTMLAGAGAARLLADPAVHWAWVATGALVSAAGVWAGVPETGPVVLAAGGIGGLAGSAALTRAHWATTAAWGVAAVLGWAAISGAAGRSWAALGGTLCTGVAPWFAVSSLLPLGGPVRSPRPWLLGAHIALVILAARWIGVDPDPGWVRAAAFAFGGIAVSVAARRRA
jgi:hypothetical protein